MHLDVLLKFPSSGGLELTEHTVLVFLADVSLEEHFCCKSYTLLRPIRHPLQAALAAPELCFAMFSFSMSFQGWFGIECGVTILLRTWMSPQALMIFSGMLVQGLLFAEALATILAAESLLPFVHSLVALESGTSDKALSTALLGTYMFPFEGMDSLDMLLQMFILNIILVTASVCALEWSGIGVRVEVVPQSSGAVEGLGTAGPGAGEGLEI